MIAPRYPQVDPRLGSITPHQLRQYLIGRGMKTRPYGRPHVEAFVGPTDLDGKKLLILFTDVTSSPDYVHTLADILVTLRDWEDRPESEIVTDILKLPKTAN